MAHRFFVEPPITGASVRLAGAEAHHLAHVLRVQAGDEVLLFDGSGAQFSAAVRRIGRAGVELTVLARTEVDRESRRGCVLGVALPKGDRQAWLVEKAVELGVARLVPLATERGVALPTDRALGRLRRTVIEASKQCGRNRLMAVEPALGAGEFFGSAPREAGRFLADPGGEPLDAARLGGGELWFAVGPEGGFTEAEARQADAAGWRRVSLGPRTLRVETAAICLAALAAAS